MMPLIILAGGLATRMYPLTQKLPKSLLPCNQQPFLFHQLHRFIAAGIDTIYLLVGKHGAQIKSFIHSQHFDKIKIAIIDEGEIPVGTAQAIRQALPALPDHFFICYGDSYLLSDFALIAQAYCAQAKPALMTVYKNNFTSVTNNVVFQEGLISKYDKKSTCLKMNHVDYGLGVFDKQIFSRYNDVDLSDLYQKLLQDNLLAGYEVREPFYEVGSFEGLQVFQEFLSNAS